MEQQPPTTTTITEKKLAKIKEHPQSDGELDTNYRQNKTCKKVGDEKKKVKEKYETRLPVVQNETHIDREREGKRVLNFASI